MAGIDKYRAVYTYIRLYTRCMQACTHACTSLKIGNRHVLSETLAKFYFFLTRLSLSLARPRNFLSKNDLQKPTEKGEREGGRQMQKQKSPAFLVNKATGNLSFLIALSGTLGVCHAPLSIERLRKRGRERRREKK